MTKEALKLALEALEEIALAGMSVAPEMIDSKEAFHARQAWRFIGIAARALDPIKEALAQPEQEPVAYIRVSKTGHVMACAKTGDFYSLPHKTLLYTTPPQRKPLTETEIRTIRCDMAGTLDVQYVAFARAIEAAHGIKEKNT
ncbi:hypothetical protein UFOVP499_32 [uncultured Caudovirales phage]|uniref:Uncharacterized protein n=1 Tax=uncultured Caudovirales phage TaxID=2100421 RepID=A0A6J5MMK1_9CAUD|nr:hypothetical protein UFOVP499_32 [uncultured Caudovirales phage]